MTEDGKTAIAVLTLRYDSRALNIKRTVNLKRNQAATMLPANLLLATRAVHDRNADTLVRPCPGGLADRSVRVTADARMVARGRLTSQGSGVLMNKQTFTRLKK